MKAEAKKKEDLTRKENEDLKQALENAKLEKERAKFQEELAKEAIEKPWIADKLQRVLQVEDYEKQKNDYRFFTEYYDNDKTREEHEAKKIAGTSAFKGTKSVQGGTDNKKLDSVVDAYLEEAKRKKKY